MKSKKLYLIQLLIMTFCANQAHAVLLDICALKNIEISNKDQFSNEMLTSYQDKLNTECELSKKYLKLQDTAVNKYSISLDQITIEKALRYVRRDFLESAAYQDTPVPLIYQKFQADYQKSNSEKSSEIWDNFAFGIKQLDGLLIQVENGLSLDLPLLLSIHKGFFRPSFDEVGDFSHEPFPGQIKIKSDQELPWWIIKDEQEAHNTQQITQQIIDQLNAGYAEMDLLSNLNNSTFPDINKILKIKAVEGGGFAIYSADTRANPYHLEKMFKFINTLFSQAHRGQHLTWKNRLLTPAEFAYRVQQFLVQMHPFAEGNGRMSRFLQELILASFNMPFGSSGDLMNIDVLTPNQDYYQIAISKNFNQLLEIQNCLEKVYPSLFFGFRKNLKDIDPHQIEYKCRLL